MSQRRAERLMNLHIMLLGARRFATKEAIRRACYPDYSQDAGGDRALGRAVRAVEEHHPAELLEHFRAQLQLPSEKRFL